MRKLGLLSLVLGAMSVSSASDTVEPIQNEASSPVLLANQILTLELCGNQFMTNEELPQYTNLKELYLGCNQFITRINFLIGLHTLSLAFNSEVPGSELRTLTNLTNLDLEYNQWGVSDDDIRHLTKLKKLNINHTSGITWKSVQHFSDLEELRAVNVPMVDGEGMKLGRFAMKKYFRNIRVLETND
jgi:hypothetical protein